MSNAINFCNLEVGFLLTDARLRSVCTDAVLIYVCTWAYCFDQRSEITQWDDENHLALQMQLWSRVPARKAKKCIKELCDVGLISFKNGVLSVPGLVEKHPNCKVWRSTISYPRGISRYRPATPAAIGAPQEVPSSSSEPAKEVPSSLKDENQPFYPERNRSGTGAEPEQEQDLDHDLEPELVCSADGSQDEEPEQDGEMKTYLRAIAATYGNDGTGREERAALLKQKFSFIYRLKFEALLEKSPEQLLPAILFALTDSRARTPETAVYEYSVKHPESLPECEWFHAEYKRLCFGP